ncbi:MAG: hypothetical protein GY953_20790, partial [bacterium]|nr:hypothetical protein [bacterium]
MANNEDNAAPADDGRTPADAGSAGALIGICGVTGAGKTVFLTSVFQSIDTVIPDHGLLT